VHRFFLHIFCVSQFSKRSGSLLNDSARIINFGNHTIANTLNAGIGLDNFSFMGNSGFLTIVNAKNGMVLDNQATFHNHHFISISECTAVCIDNNGQFNNDLNGEMVIFSSNQDGILNLSEFENLGSIQILYLPGKSLDNRGPFFKRDS